MIVLYQVVLYHFIIREILQRGPRNWQGSAISLKYLHDDGSALAIETTTTIKTGGRQPEVMAHPYVG